MTSHLARESRQIRRRLNQHRSFIGTVIASSQGERFRSFHLIPGSNLTVSMFQLINQMLVQYDAGHERQTLLRLLFPPGSWDDSVRTPLVRMLLGRCSSKAAPDVSTR